MFWNNKSRWHLDHICPISAFEFKTSNDIDFQRCWCLGNLQPLWMKDNMEKSNILLGSKKSLEWFNN